MQFHVILNFFIPLLYSTIVPTLRENIHAKCGVAQVTNKYFYTQGTRAPIGPMLNVIHPGVKLARQWEMFRWSSVLIGSKKTFGDESVQCLWNDFILINIIFDCFRIMVIKKIKSFKFTAIFLVKKTQKFIHVFF